MSSTGQDLGDDALVAVAAGHLVADRDLAVDGDQDLDDLDDAGREFVSLLHLVDLFLDLQLQGVDMQADFFLHLADQVLAASSEMHFLISLRKAVVHLLKVLEPGWRAPFQISFCCKLRFLTQFFLAQQLADLLEFFGEQDLFFIGEIPLQLGGLDLVDLLARACPCSGRGG